LKGVKSVKLLPSRQLEVEGLAVMFTRLDNGPIPISYPSFYKYRRTLILEMYSDL